MVPKGTQNAERVRVKDQQEQKNDNRNENTPKQRLEAKLPTYTPYRRVEEIVAKSGKTEDRKRNYSYLDEVDSYKPEKKKNNEEDVKDVNPYFQ